MQEVEMGPEKVTWKCQRPRPHRKALQCVAAPSGKVASLAAEMDDPEHCTLCAYRSYSHFTCARA